MNIDETSQLLGVISGIEPRFRKPDPLITAMWHEIVQRIPLDVAARAVADYYGREADRVIMPADVTRFARLERQADAVPYHRPVRERLAAIDAQIETENAALATRLEAERRQLGIEVRTP